MLFEVNSREGGKTSRLTAKNFFEIVYIILKEKKSNEKVLAENNFVIHYGVYL
jgi:hypothetical protein